VTSAFIVQIIPALQPNPIDLTNALLLRILQQNTSFGGNNPLAPISNTPISIVRAQSILFASLSLTLFVAFISVLGKQWILYYTRVTTWGNIADRGKERQAKLLGLQKWGLRLILDSVPVMLQFSLFLFGAALAVYLWDLEVSVAEVVLVITFFSFAFYVCITVAAMLWGDCPFQTPLSVLLPEVLRLAKVLIAPFRSRRWWKRRITSFLPLIEWLTKHGHLTNAFGRVFKIFAGGTTFPAPLDGDTPSTDYPMTLSNRAFWRDRPLFTSPISKDIAASAGSWLLENSTDFSVAAAVAAVFSEFQWPSHHRSSTALIRLRDMYMECFRVPESRKSAHLEALRSAAAYYVLYHTQLIWSTWKSFEAGAEIEELPSGLPPDLFLQHNDEWGGDDLFEYLLHINVEDRSEPVESARFLSYIAPYWFCGDADAAIRFRPSRLQTLNELIEVLERSRALTPATVTNCILCAGVAMDFPLHPEDLVRVDKRCVLLPSYVTVGLTGDSDYFALTFKLVVEHIHGIALTKGRRRRYVRAALEILVTLVKKTSFPLVEATWISDLLKRAAWGKMDDEPFTALLRFSALRKEDDAAINSEISFTQDYDHIQRGEADPLSPGGTVRPEDRTPESALLDLILRNVGNCSAQKDGWQDDAVYGGLTAIRDIPGLRFYLPQAEFLETLSRAMEKGETIKGERPFRVRKAAYDLVLAARDGLLKSPDLRETLECIDFPKKLHSVVTETFRSDHQRSFLEMMEILSEDRHWRPYLRKEMVIWLPLHREGPVHALRILTNVGELRRRDFDVDKSLEKVLEDEWAAVPGRPPKELTADLLEPLAEVTKQFRELLFFTEGGRKGVLGMVERVIPGLEERRDGGYSGPGDDIRRIIDDLRQTLRVPIQSNSRRSTYW